MNEFKGFYKSIKHRKYNTWCKYTTILDTYGRGCQHNCDYCYAKSLLSFRGLWNTQFPAVADIYKINKKLQNIKYKTTIKLGGMTDCFQPIEQKYKVTYTVIQLLNDYKIPYLIVTKSNNFNKYG